MFSLLTCVLVLLFCYSPIKKPLQSFDYKGLGIIIKYPGRDLNPHGHNGHWILSPTCLPFHHLGITMSGKRDSDSRPRPWQGRALPTELFPHCNYPKRTFFILSGKRDSDSRPRPWQGRALPTELFPHKHFANWCGNSF